MTFPARHVAVSVVDDYTIKLMFVKTEVGLAPLVAGLLILGLVAVTAVSAAVIVSMWVSVELGRQQIIDKLIDERSRVIDQYLNEVSQCTDPSCINNVQNKYLPIISSINETIGEIYGKACDGVELFGSCIPWYVFVIVAAFVLAVLIMR